MFIDKNPNAR